MIARAICLADCDSCGELRPARVVSDCECGPACDSCRADGFCWQGCEEPAVVEEFDRRLDR